MDLLELLLFQLLPDIVARLSARPHLLRLKRRTADGALGVRFPILNNLLLHNTVPAVFAHVRVSAWQSNRKLVRRAAHAAVNLHRKRSRR